MKSITDAWFREGLRQYRAGNRGAALEAFRTVLEQDPGHAAAWADTGILLLEEGKASEALAPLERAVALDPGDALARQALGRLHLQEGRPESALEQLEEACRLQPTVAALPFDLASARWARREWEGAEAAYREALRLQPEFAKAKWNLAHLLLLRGRWREGWEAFESRFTLPPFLPMIQGLPRPHWDGRDLGGGTLLVHTEQGLGDSLMMARFLPEARRRAGRLILVCQPELLDLLGSLEGVDEALPWGAPLPPAAAHLFTLSLPGALGVEEKSLKSQVPYLAAPGPTARRRELEARLGPPGHRMGLVWKGHSGHVDNPSRSMEAEALAPLGDLPGVRWFSLQKGAGAEPRPFAPLVELGDLLQDFGDTAFVLERLDHLVTVDTSVAHLAGAMGRPASLMLPWMPDWRWMLDREDSPWYPSLRLFRQPRPGDWASVVQRIRHEVRGT